MISRQPSGTHPAMTSMAGRDAERRRPVVGALPVELEPEATAIRPLGVGTVGDDQRTDARLTVAPDPEDAAALGRTQPLVGVPGPVADASRFEGGDVDRHLAGRVGAVDEDLDAAVGQRVDQVDDGHHDGGRAGDGAQHDEAGPRPHGIEDPFDDGLGAVDREGQRGDVERGAVARGHEGCRVQDRVVLVVGGQDAIARLEAERAQDRVDPRRRVGDEGQVVRIRVQERALPADAPRPGPARGHRRTSAPARAPCGPATHAAQPARPSGRPRTSRG